MAVYTVNGTNTVPNTLSLDEPLPVSSGEIEVALKSDTPAEPNRKWQLTLEKIRAAQAARGHIPRTREEIDRELAELRSEWDD